MEENYCEGHENHMCDNEVMFRSLCFSSILYFGSCRSVSSKLESKNEDCLPYLIVLCDKIE